MVSNTRKNRRNQEVVLILESDQGVKELTRDMLELAGHQVLTAGTKAEALALCDQWGAGISLLLLDASLEEPGPGGTIAGKILEKNPGAKIIITSVFSRDWTSADIFGQGATAFLRKPYRMAELFKMVEKVQLLQ